MGGVLLLWLFVSMVSPLPMRRSSQSSCKGVCVCVCVYDISIYI